MPLNAARSRPGGQRAAVAGFTHVRTWQGVGYAAVVLDMHARHCVGCRLGSSIHTDFVLDALPLELYTCRRERDGEVNPPYVSIRHSEWLAESGIEITVGSTCDRDEHTLAETINGQYSAKVIQRCGL